ncbi:hypothetical protein B0T22DRAFT_173066 [Podospora appendiculata]|uniref:Microbial-type PARG catalytic domain-containing protein n=1 Tax=Podospora appendiculata TaxID=314037 RepID=A0AAE0XBA9_9PEZI|nr:hypothetical protein B0T22DRAFT_173066 [Podospora appendiculata]
MSSSGGHPAHRQDGTSASHHDPNSQQRRELRAAAQETIQVLRGLLPSLGRVKSAEACTKYSLSTLPRLDPSLCPSYHQPAIIEVVNQDTISAAIDLLQRAPVASHGPCPANEYPLVVNFANRHRPGGGWLNGAMAQEEALCYRSSLSYSLDPRLYPLERWEALYSPYVLVMRHEMAQGHGLMYPAIPASQLPALSAVTVAAIHGPAVHSFTLTSRAPGDRVQTLEKLVFAHDRDRNLTKDKMRLALRRAAFEGHRMLVLGALGCGVFGNPPEAVAHCWLEVLRENEFAGNWWTDVRFAVYDQGNDGNYAMFKAVLDGRKV